LSLNFSYENGVAKGTAKMPKGKNYKGDWEKRYLVFEDSICHLNIYKEVSFKSASPPPPRAPSLHIHT
jgi:hypothetical protein